MRGGVAQLAQLALPPCISSSGATQPAPGSRIQRPSGAAAARSPGAAGRAWPPRRPPPSQTRTPAAPPLAARAPPLGLHPPGAPPPRARQRSVRIRPGPPPGLPWTPPGPGAGPAWPAAAPPGPPPGELSAASPAPPAPCTPAAPSPAGTRRSRRWRGA